MKTLLPSRVRQTLLLLMLMAVVTPAVQAQTAPIELDCASLYGAGTFSNPLFIGRVDRPTIVVGCPRLTAGEVNRHYTFDLVRTASSSALIATGFIYSPSQAAVLPRLSLPSGTVLIPASRGQWSWQPPWLFRYFRIAGLRAGRYILGVEKQYLWLPETADFDLYIYP